jgi:hypothetical protein
MSYTILSDNDLNNLDLPALIQKQDYLRHTIDIAWQSVKCLEQSALGAERSRRGLLSFEDETWIRANVSSRHQSFLDALHIDLERVDRQIAARQ